MEPVPVESTVIQRRWIEIAAASGVVLLVVLGCLKVLLPFASAILWSIVLCLATWPLYMGLQRFLHLHDQRSLAALAMTFSLAIVAVAPFAIAFWGLSEQAKEVTKTVSLEIEFWPPPLPDWLANLPTVGPWLEEYWEEPTPAETAQRSMEVSHLMEEARTVTVRVVRAIGRGMLETLLALFIAFFLYRDGETLAARVRALSGRIAGSEHGVRMLEVAYTTIIGVIFGILGTALGQGLLAEIGFAVARVPGALLLAFLTFAFSIIPFGPAVIWIPATLWLFYHGNHKAAVFLLLWSIGSHAVVDTFLKPMLISRGGKLPLVLVLIGVLGGATSFGFIGVFLGPTLLAVGYRWLDEWSAEAALEP
jgi:predicted PurR-regulated permease PerM